MAYTVSKIAEELNLSRQHIYNKIKSLSDELKHFTYKDKGTTYITEEGYKIIVNSMKQNVDKEDTKQAEKPHNNDLSNALNSLQQDYINSLKEQIETLRNQNEQLTQQLQEKERSTLEVTRNFQLLLSRKDEKIMLLEEKVNKPWWKLW